MNNYSGGQLVNMISNDCTRLEFSLYFAPFLIVGPIEAVVITYILARTIDVSILSGLAVLIVAIPLQSLLGKVFDRLRYVDNRFFPDNIPNFPLLSPFYGHLRRITSKKCDKRINLLNEILNGIKIIKMYCWEEPFKKLISTFRK
jgi:ATP-binding cassette subfamily C (CFTR/MRP) protein 4